MPPAEIKKISIHNTMLLFSPVCGEFVSDIDVAGFVVVISVSVLDVAGFVVVISVSALDVAGSVVVISVAGLVVAGSVVVVSVAGLVVATRYSELSFSRTCC
ncbi:MAG: hypothetical protein ACLT2Z_01785 [Eubacterium sp.]